MPFTAPVTRRTKSGATVQSASKSWGYIEGGPELAAALAKLEQGLRDELLVKATTAGAQVIADEWHARIVADVNLGPGTAHYRDAVGVRARPGKKGATAWVGLPNELPLAPGEDHPRDYAPALEFKDHPTLRPAFEASKERALSAMADELRRLINDAVPGSLT